MWPWVASISGKLGSWSLNLWWGCWIIWWVHIRQSEKICTCDTNILTGSHSEGNFFSLGQEVMILLHLYYIYTIFPLFVPLPFLFLYSLPLDKSLTLSLPRLFSLTAHKHNICISEVLGLCTGPAMVTLTASLEMQQASGYKWVEMSECKGMPTKFTVSGQAEMNRKKKNRKGRNFTVKLSVEKCFEK